MNIQLIDSIHSVRSEDWDSLCNNDYPFIRYSFLAALEDSQSVGANTGWKIAHLVVHKEEKLIAAMPGYIKTHSYGEYVFDWSWADAYRRYGKNYYPKWINAIPFTPCTGPRLLWSTKEDLSSLVELIAKFLQKLCEEKSLSGWHCLFPDDHLHQELKQQNINTRSGCQFHWFNRGYLHFDDFLSHLNSRKRKNIKKERRIAAQEFSFVKKYGEQIKMEDAELFYTLYRNTYLKRSGHEGYLSKDFFISLIEKMPEQIVLVQAIKTDSHQIIAAALFLKDSQTLYGRYWGCLEEYPFLHFETCYYQAIDYAIDHQLQRVDGGAQGEHKIARGFEPCITWSHHWISDVDFQPAIAHFLLEEAEAIKSYAADATDFLPFKQTLTHFKT